MRIARGISIANASKPLSTAAAFDADALAYFTANTAITSTADKNAINTFFLGLKSDGIYTKMKAMYLPIWGSAATCKWNLKDPRDLEVAYRLNFATGWTYSSTGITPNGATYANTFLIPSSVFNTTTFESYSYYSRTNATSIDDYVIGSFNGVNGTNCGIIGRRTTTNLSGVFSNYNSGISYQDARYTNTDGRGFYLGNQQGTGIKFYKNNSLVAQNTTVATNANQSTYSVYLGALNYLNTVSGATTKECSFAHLGEKLTDAEAANFSNRVNTLMTYFGINIY